MSQRSRMDRLTTATGSDSKAAEILTRSILPSNDGPVVSKEFTYAAQLAHVKALKEISEDNDTIT